MRILPIVLIFLSFCFSDITKTVCSTGADYATPAAFELAYTTNLSRLGVVSANHCAETFDVTGLIIAGQTNSSVSDYLSFNGSGIRATTFLATSGTYGISINTGYHRFVNLNMRSSGASVMITAFAVGNRMSRSVVRQEKNGGACTSAEGAANGQFLLYSNAFMCSGTGTTYGVYALQSGNNITAYNNVITGCLQGFTSLDAGTTTTIKNTAFNVTNAFTGSSTYTVDYNACKNTGCNGASSLNNVPVGNFPSDSINIATSSTLYNVGTNLSSIFTMDVNSKTWGVWSIGANDPTPIPSSSSRCGILYRMGLAPRGR